MNRAIRIVLCSAVLLVPAAALAQDPAPVLGPEFTPTPQAPQATPPAPRADHETNCADRLDDDGDSLVDCADSDCFEQEHVCASNGLGENSDDRCSDWIDNDGDGAIDCEDDDCTNTPGVRFCQGSYRGPASGGGGGASALGDSDSAIPELSGDQTIEDLIGQGGDVDGERSDEVCADGADNDGDGRTDCADFGCRFDPSVTVCQGQPGIRFSAAVGFGINWQTQSRGRPEFNTASDGGTFDALFDRIQLRVLGPIPYIQNSFFMLQMRMERTPRLTFALFQVPLGGGHSLSINSGGGGLSTALIIGTQKQLLLDPPFFVFNAFEQGNGGAVEVAGPLGDTPIFYRAFAAAGAGESTGNVGGRFFRADNTNFSWAAGAQFTFNLAGNYNRFDTPYLYTPVPLTLALIAGGKFDQRPIERFPAMNFSAVFRYQYFLATAESYTRFETEYGTIQSSFLAQLGVLVWPRHLMLAGDFGFLQRLQGPRMPPPGGFGSDTFRQPLNELQWRAGAHYYFWRNIGLVSFIYRERLVEANPDRPQDVTFEREFKLELQYRF